MPIAIPGERDAEKLGRMAGTAQGLILGSDLLNISYNSLVWVEIPERGVSGRLCRLCGSYLST